MKHLNETLKKSMINKLEKHYHCYLVVPTVGYSYLANTYGYESNYIKMREDMFATSPHYGCWVLSQEEIENYKKQFPDHRNDAIYEILSKETDPLKFVKYLKRHPSIGFKDTKWFKEITL